MAELPRWGGAWGQLQLLGTWGFADEVIRPGPLGAGAALDWSSTVSQQACAVLAQVWCWPGVEAIAGGL